MTQDQASVAMQACGLAVHTMNCVNAYVANNPSVAMFWVAVAGLACGSAIQLVGVLFGIYIKLYPRERRYSELKNKDHRKK